MRLGKINSLLIDAGRRLAKVFILSKSDVQTSYMIGPWGDDSAPIKNADIVHSKTTGDESIILGCINTNSSVEPGEKRIYATDENGAEIIDIYLRKNGTIEIGGSGESLTIYGPLNDNLQTTIIDINTELVKIQSALVSLGGSYARLDVNLDIRDSESTKLKTS